MNKEALLKQAKEASRSPGVYLMKNTSGKVLYIGKAKSLRNRVSSYFLAGAQHTPRIEMLVGQIDSFDVILTETEAEALILECNLIKKNKPKFNVRLKDDKAYPYIRIKKDEEFPRLEWAREVKKKKGYLYFGPFPSAWSARQMLYFFNETFQLRDCSDNTFRHRTRPCILYQMQKCSAPCVGKVNKEEYSKTVNQVVRVLEGKDKTLLKDLENKMKDASHSLEYELAATYRDQLENLKIVTETQSVDEANAFVNKDVIAIARKDLDAHGVLLEVRSGKMLAMTHYSFQNVDTEVTDDQILFDFISQYYLEKLKQKDLEENELTQLLVTAPPCEKDLLEKVFKLNVIHPKKKTDSQLLAVAHSNAQHALEMNKKRSLGHGVKALEEIQKQLHLDELPLRMECYDVSNIQGQDAVASRVVFIDGSPEKELYRRYKIKTVEGVNDFAMMKEVLLRRFSKKDEDLHQLLVVDGGKGQLSQAVSILEELNIQGVATVGLAKARVESDFKEKEVRSSMERIFIPNRKNPVSLKPNTPAYQLLTHIRDEAHRFAITYHRSVRKKRTLGKGNE